MTIVNYQPSPSPLIIYSSYGNLPLERTRIKVRATINGFYMCSYLKGVYKDHVGPAHTSCNISVIITNLCLYLHGSSIIYIYISIYISVSICDDWIVYMYLFRSYNMFMHNLHSWMICVKSMGLNKYKNIFSISK